MMRLVATTATGMLIGIFAPGGFDDLQWWLVVIPANVVNAAFWYSFIAR